MKQYVYSFKEGNKDMRVILGGKGANLAEMTSIGLPVPQGFTVSTEACTAYYEDGKQISPEICAQIDNKLAELEAETGKKLGDPTNPLLVSVRSGARESMPGMMDTVLNLGLFETTRSAPPPKAHWLRMKGINNEYNINCIASTDEGYDIEGETR